MSRTSCDRVLSPCGHSSTNQIWSGLLAGIRLTVRLGRGGFSATSRSILKISSNVIAQASTPLDGPSTRRTPLTRKSYANIEQQRIEAPKATRHNRIVVSSLQSVFQLRLSAKNQKLQPHSPRLATSLDLLRAGRWCHDSSLYFPKLTR